MSTIFRRSLLSILITCALSTASLSAIETVHKVAPGESLSVLARTYGCTVDELKSFNNLTRDTLYRGEELKIPPRYPDTHRVSPGDTLSGISARYGIPQDKLISLNRMKDTALRIGQELELIRPPYEGESWTVRRGDTLSWISLKFNISQARLRQINALENSALRTGQVLDLTASRPQTLTVESGDSLWKIASRYNLAMEDLKSWNSLSGDVLRRGTELQLYPVVLELSDAERLTASSTRSLPATAPAAAPAPAEKPVETENTPASTVKLASISTTPLYISNPTQRRTQPSLSYFEEDLGDPMDNYRRASALISDFDEAARSLPPLSRNLEGYTVILDPGHGGLDPGAIVESVDGLGNKVYVVEDEYCYDIALRVYRDLIRHGADVHLTVISPTSTIRTTTDASLTFVNLKNEVYNSKAINSQNRYSVWPVGNAWGLDQRKVVAGEFLKGVGKQKSIFVSIHADNNPGDGEGTRILYSPSEKGKASQDLAEEMSRYMGRGSDTRAQEVRVLRNNPAGASVLVEVRNLAYTNNSWAIRNEDLRQDDADRIVRGIVSYLR